MQLIVAKRFDKKLRLIRSEIKKSKTNTSGKR